MRKVLSIVLALLMVSMMIPSMAFAADDLSATGVPAVALVAGQSFDLTIASASANVTVKVNTNVFDLPGTEDVAGKIGYITCAPGTVTITVKTDIPTEAFTSTIRVEDEDDAISIPVKVDDRKLGDANNDGSVNISDITLVYMYIAGEIVEGHSSYTVFNKFVANTTQDDYTNISDITQLYIYIAGEAGESSPVGKFANGTREEVEFSDEFGDPESWETTTEPDEPETKPLDAVEKVTAVVSGETIYYDFTAVANATGYQISVNGAVVENTADLTGSFAVPEGFKADGTDTISVIALGDNVTTTNSPAKDATITVAAPSTALADWLKANGLEDVVITVYEITE